MNDNLTLELVKNYLNSLEYYPDEEELQKIISLAQKQDAYEHNKGIRVVRIKHNEREKAFHDQWLKENMPIAGLNHGFGILQDLFIDSTSDKFSIVPGRKIIEVITNRDRMIVATVIQWLGSNCGMSFLYEALKRFDARIVENYKNTNP